MIRSLTILLFSTFMMKAPFVYGVGYSCNNYKAGESLTVTLSDDLLDIVISDTRPYSFVSNSFRPILGDEVTRARLRGVFKRSSCIEKENNGITEFTCINFAMLDPLFLTKCGIKEFDANSSGEFSDSIYTTCAANRLPEAYAPYTLRLKKGSYISYALRIPTPSENIQDPGTHEFSLALEIYNSQFDLALIELLVFDTQNSSQHWKQSTKCVDSIGQTY